MGKAVILFLYAISVTITVKEWYNAGNSGMPSPQVIAPATYLFAILALTAEFIETLPVILAAALTVVLYERTHPLAGVKIPQKVTNAPVTTLNLGGKKP